MSTLQRLLGAGTIAALIAELSEPLETNRQLLRVGRKSALREFHCGLRDTQRFGDAIAHAQHFQFVVQDLPQLFVPFHFASPTLAQLTNEMGCELFGGGRQSLAFIRVHVATDKETRGPEGIGRRRELLARAIHERIANTHR